MLTDNGTHFTSPGNTASAAPDIKATIEAGERFWAHAFEYACAQHDIDHRLTKPKHPWTNGQVEQMNRTLKDATVKRYETHDELKRHLTDFIVAYNYARRLKTLKGLTRYEFICKTWTNEPQRFILNPLHQMPGLSTYRPCAATYGAESSARKVRQESLASNMGRRHKVWTKRPVALHPLRPAQLPEVLTEAVAPPHR